MEPLEVLITLPQRYSNCTCGCYYGNRKPTTADTIDENNEDSIVLERLRLLEQSMIMMRLQL
jgi:hypothetical protein